MLEYSSIPIGERKDYQQMMSAIPSMSNKEKVNLVKNGIISLEVYNEEEKEYEQEDVKVPYQSIKDYAMTWAVNDETMDYFFKKGIIDQQQIDEYYLGKASTSEKMKRQTEHESSMFETLNNSVKRFGGKVTDRISDEITKVRSEMHRNIPKSVDDESPSNDDIINMRSYMRKNKTSSIYKKYGDHISEASKKYGIREELIASIISAESGGVTGAVSNKGARGLMQVMPDTAKELSHDTSDSHRLLCYWLFLGCRAQILAINWSYFYISWLHGWR
jgi:hypothetical protein